MQKHVKVYMEHFGYGEQDYIKCELCASRAVDIHHIHGRGKDKDVIENLMALCRKCHSNAHANNYGKYYLEQIHKRKMR